MGRVIELAENAMQELGLAEGDYSVDAVMDSGRSSAALAVLTLLRVRSKVVAGLSIRV